MGGGEDSSFGEARLRLRLRLLRERKGPWKGRHCTVLHCTVGTVLCWTGGWKSGRIPGSGRLVGRDTCKTGVTYMHYCTVFEVITYDLFEECTGS